MTISTNPENIDAILLRVARGEKLSAIGVALGMHRQTVAKVVASEAYQKRVAFLEKLMTEKSGEV